MCFLQKEMKEQMNHFALTLDECSVRKPDFQALLAAAVFILAIDLGWYCNLRYLAIFCVLVLDLSLVPAFYELQDEECRRWERARGGPGSHYFCPQRQYVHSCAGRLYPGVAIYQFSLVLLQDRDAISTPAFLRISMAVLISMPCACSLL